MLSKQHLFPAPGRHPTAWRTARSCTAPTTEAASQDVTPLHGCRCWSCQDRLAEMGQNKIRSDGERGSPLPAGVPLQPVHRRPARIPHPLCCRRKTPRPHWEGIQQWGWLGVMCCWQSKNTHQVQKARGSPRAVLCTGCESAFSAECFRPKATPCGPATGEQLCKTALPA